MENSKQKITATVARDSLNIIKEQVGGVYDITLLAGVIDDFVAQVEEEATRPYIVGDLTAKYVFQAAGLKNLSETQLVWDAVEMALAKFVPFSGLDVAQVERLVMASEESAEVIKAACKVLRHGYESYNPDRPQDGDNRAQLVKEMIDYTAVLVLMEEAQEVPSHVGAEVFQAIGRKLKYSHHQQYLHFGNYQADPRNAGASA